MGKCLVTRLNGVVDALILKYLDSVVIQFKAVDKQTEKNSSIVVEPVSGTSVNIECVQGNFTNSDFSKDTGNTLTAVIGTRLYVSNGAIIKLKDKQNILKISFDDGVGDDANKVIDLDDLKYCKNLKTIILSGDIQGKLDFSVKKSIGILHLNNTDFYTTMGEIVNALSPIATSLNLTKATAITGDISILSDKTSLSILYTTYTEISGSVESLLEGMWNKGRRTGTLQIQTGHNVSFDGATHEDYGYTVNATFSDVGIMAKSDITKTFNGTSWIKS